ncbi:hypothetical protein, partial [Pseudomonas viridiflava]|uniref:hypothetical protein n=1 Tax=Pseudomonas viridiflava TaxID=33069 RepID=UPI0019824AAA
MQTYYIAEVRSETLQSRHSSINERPKQQKNDGRHLGTHRLISISHFIASWPIAHESPSRGASC